MFSASQKNWEPKTSLDLTSMIDILFIILIFVTVTAVFARDKQIQLPKHGSAVPGLFPRWLNVTIDRDNNYSIAQQKLTKEELTLHLQDLAQRDRDRVIVIRPDGDSGVKYTTYVHGLCQELGLQSRLAVTQKKKG
jgi:biopolymer transport protein ExbD